MGLTTWLSLVGACAVISLTPGAGAVNTMSTSLLYGWRRSIWTILGQQAALIVQILIVAAGLGLVVANSPFIFDAIRYGGALYLVYLGIKMMLTQPTTAHSTPEGHAVDTTATPAHSAASAESSTAYTHSETTRLRNRRIRNTRKHLQPGAPWTLLQRGFWVNMSNPKAIVFILAFTPQFLNTSEAMVPQYAILMATMVALDIIVMWAGFAVVAKSLTRFTQSGQGQRRLNIFFGLLFIAVAFLLVFLEH